MATFPLTFGPMVRVCFDGGSGGTRCLSCFIISCRCSTGLIIKAMAYDLHNYDPHGDMGGFVREETVSIGPEKAPSKDKYDPSNDSRGGQVDLQVKLSQQNKHCAMEPVLGR